MIDPQSERQSHLHLAHSYAQRAAERAALVAAALNALQATTARLSETCARGEAPHPEPVWLSVGAAEALVAALVGELDGVLDHLTQLDPSGGSAEPVAEALRALRRNR